MDPSEYQLQADFEQRGLAADIRQREDNATKKMREDNATNRILKRGDRRFLNAVIHDPDLTHQPQHDKGLKRLANLWAPDLVSNRERERKEPTEASPRDSLAPAFLAITGLAVLGVSAYRGSQERKRQEEKRRAMLQAAAMGGLVVFWLWYAGWLYFLVCSIACALTAALLAACCLTR